MPDDNDISPKELLHLIATPDCPVLVDISIDADFDSDPYLIPAAIRYAHSDIPQLIQRLNGAACIVICQKGGKLSQGVASWLRTGGLPARHLNGGNHAWREQPDAPSLPAARLAKLKNDGSVWVTGERPNADQIACHWLVQRFIDRTARTLFVEASEVAGASDRFGAATFEGYATDLALGDRQCRFAAMLYHFDLIGPFFHHIADTVRGATPESSGIETILAGVRVRYPRDEDYVQAAISVFDALFLSALSDNNGSEDT